MFLMETFVLWLERELDRRGWRPADLAHRAGIPNATLSRVLNGTRRAGPDVGVALARALNADPVVVFRRAGLLPPTVSEQAESDPAFREILQLYKGLSPGDRRTALRLFRGLASSAGSGGEAADAQRIEHLFDAGGEARLAEEPTERRRVFVDLFNTLSDLASPGDLLWAAEWFRRAREVYEDEEGGEDVG